MKIAISTIARNEEANVQAFVDSCVGADLISIYDTGSTDGTIELLKKNNAYAGGSVCHQPLDFGEARNLALDCLPDDIDVVVSIDLDERLQPGWREAIEKAWKDGAEGLSYWYVAEWADEAKTVPAVEGWRSKIFDPKKVKWFRPIHEVPMRFDKTPFNSFPCKEIIVHHFQTGTRDYSGQLTMYLEDHPEDTDAYLQRAAEFLKAKQFEKAIGDYETFLDLTRKNTCENKNCDSCQLRAGKRARAWVDTASCQLSMRKNVGEVIQSLLFATAECPYIRDVWIYLADAWMSVGDYPAAYGAAMKGLSIKSNGINVKDGMCWGDAPRQIASTALTKMLEKFNLKP